MKNLSPKVIDVKTNDDFRLLLTFENGEERILNLTPYLKNFFSELEDPMYFKRVFVEEGSIAWPHGQDLAFDMLYVKSELLAVTE